MPPRNETLKLETNKPRTILIERKFGDGINQYGEWHGLSIKDGETEKTLFANSYQYNTIQPYIGKIVQLTQTDKKDWVVGDNNKALFDEKGKATPEPKIDPLYDKEAMGSIRAGRRDLLHHALSDARDMVFLHNDSIQDKSRPTAIYALDHADIRAIALTLLIEYYKRF